MQSRYVVKAPSYNGDSNIYYNISSGIGIKVPKDIARNFKELTNLKLLTPVLEKHKFFRDENEATKVLNEYALAKQNSSFHLIIMPHQNCNFRCVYCYEKFEKNKMLPSIEQAITSLVEQKIREEKHKVFSVSWFGGEPLLAIDVIDRLSRKFIDITKNCGATYVAGITTNGYDLNEKNIDCLLSSGVNHFQITVDGPKVCHDHQRILKGGQPTYDRIINNLLNLSKRKERFKVIIRMNVGPNNVSFVDEHIQEMKDKFGKDNRFVLYFHNIGHWGGENDHNVEICSENMAVKLINLTIDHKMNVDSDAINISPNSTCYASSENSFVIGVDGMVYKCTVALYDQSNHVGYLKTDGKLVLDQSKMNLWTQSGINDSTCKDCFFAPSCHGDSCPLIRIEKNTQPCPAQKKNVRQYITLMDRHSNNFITVKRKVQT